MNPACPNNTRRQPNLYSSTSKLKKEYLNDHLVESKAFFFNKDYPIIYPEDENSAKTFATNKIIITNFKYPSAAKDLNRIVITANHRRRFDKIIQILNHS
jgi:hypothetical protein